MDKILGSLKSIVDFLHRSEAPLDLDGAKPIPGFLQQKLEDIETELVRGKPFKLSDLVRVLFCTVSMCTVLESELWVLVGCC